LAGGPIWAVIFAVAAVGGWVMYYLESQAEGGRQEAEARARAAREEMAARQQTLQERLQAARETAEELRQRLRQQADDDDTAQLRRRVERLEAERERLREALDASRGDRRNLQEKLSSARTERDRLQARLQERGRQEGRIEDELGELVDQRRALEERLDTARADREATAAEREALQERVSEAGREVAEKKEELAAARARIDAIRRETEAAADKVEGLQAEVQRLKAEKERQAREFDRLQKALKEELANKRIRLEKLEQGRAVIAVDARVLFDSGSAWVQPRGERVLQQIARLLNAFPDRRIRVAGHTDAMPIGPNLEDRYPSNWELSTARASAAVRYLEWAGGVDPKRMAAMGYAENRPVARNDKRAGRARNRRIEIQLLPAEPRQRVRVVEPDGR